jgi:hypothetical protein
MSGSDASAKSEWIARVLGASRPESEGKGSSGSPAPSKERYDKSLVAQWQAVREAATESLIALENALERSGDAFRQAAIPLLRTVRTNLMENPETPKQIDNLKEYIANDDIIKAAEIRNIFGVNVSIRQPLTETLAAMHDQLGRKGTNR